MGKVLMVVLSVVCVTMPAMALEEFERDTIETAQGALEITFIGHGTLMFRLGDKVIHVDPWSRLGDYAKMPEADLILLTHHHTDHLDPAALREIRTDSTVIVLTPVCSRSVEGGVVMENGDVTELLGIEVRAVPAYNLVHARASGEPFHPKGEGNGYVLTIGDTRVYIAGDTENTPEMKALEDVDVAFLPVNLPYTMSVEMVLDAVRAFKPAILYPYHYGDTDMAGLVDMLKEIPETEVRIRKME